MFLHPRMTTNLLNLVLLVSSCILSHQVNAGNDEITTSHSDVTSQLPNSEMRKGNWRLSFVISRTPEEASLVAQNSAGKENNSRPPVLVNYTSLASDNTKHMPNEAGTGETLNPLENRVYSSSTPSLSNFGLRLLHSETTTVSTPLESSPSPVILDPTLTKKEGVVAKLIPVPLVEGESSAEFKSHIPSTFNSPKTTYEFVQFFPSPSEEITVTSYDPNDTTISTSEIKNREETREFVHQSPSTLEKNASAASYLTTTPSAVPVTEKEDSTHYSFSSSQDDGISDLHHSRQETRVGHTVTGSYSYSDGYLKRSVQYIADSNGFRIISDISTPLIPGGPNINPDGLATVNADVGGQPYNYVVRGQDISNWRKYLRSRSKKN